jgi:hypothetical protein
LEDFYASPNPSAQFHVLGATILAGFACIFWVLPVFQKEYAYTTIP